MKNLPHPGLRIRMNCLEALGLSVTEGAKALGMARHTLSRALHGHAAISLEMAIRLERAGWSEAGFRCGGRWPTIWLRLGNVKNSYGWAMWWRGRRAEAT